MGNFVHLHLHTEYSLLDGACRIDRMLDRILEMGQTSVAITDHGVMYGVIDFYKAAKAKGIHPVIGCEVYVAPRTRFDKVNRVDTSPYHLVLLCENQKGYENLTALVSQGFTEGFYFKPRVDKELLRQHSEGLIALSACLAGELPRKLRAGDYPGAKALVEEYQSIFGKDNYFIEIQDHGLQEQKEILPRLVQLSRETGAQLVATNDAHYIRKEDHRMQNLLVCIQTNHTVDEPNDMAFETQEFYLKSREEMEQMFGKLPEALDNTERIARRCQVEFEFGQTKLPYFQAPDGIENREYFRKLCFEGLTRRYGENPPEAYRERLEHELQVVEKMGYVDYYLIVYDFIRYARSQNIPVGPGRGSGAGSIAAYCMGITNIDPMRYQLLFERFLNPERVSMPDFDIDFCFERRQEVIDYVVHKYGADHVAQIITFGTMAARGAIRDVGRALGLSYQMVDSVAKLVPMELKMTLEKALKGSSELKELYDQNQQVKELIDLARELEGMPRHASTHAAGVVITRDPVTAYVPVQKNDEAIVTQFPMTTLEELGLLKMDFLGLRNLTVIRRAEETIQKKEPGFQADEIPIDDTGVFEMLSAGLSDGVFQFESGGMRQVLTQLKPVSLEDLIAVISLYRPGPMDSIPKYIENRHHPEKVTYLTPQLKPVLEVTYGCIVYQEQVMQICRQLAGYSYGRADMVRRAMSKKKADVMEKERQNFIYGAKKPDGTVECVGAVANGVPEAAAIQIFDEMSSFASYAFNKSHAAAYAYVAYQTAYLKLHYPREYMAALLTCVLDSTSKVTEYIGECERQRIKVLPVDVNQSWEEFAVTEEGIRFSLLAVKNIGRGFIRELLQKRQERPFESFADFCERMYGGEMNKRTMESLIKCGAFDSLNPNRKQLLLGYDRIIGELEEERRQNLEGQMNLFFSEEDTGPGKGRQYSMPPVEDFSPKERLAMEKEITGIYISGHPMLEYQPVAEKIHASPMAELLEQCREHGAAQDGRQVTVVGVVTGRKTKTTKNGDMMAFITLEDMGGTMEMLVFPKSFANYRNLFQEGQGLVIKGRLSVREEEDAKLICGQVFSAEDYKANRYAVPGGTSQETEPDAMPISGAVPEDDRVPPESPGIMREAAESSYVPQKPANRKQGLYLRVKSRQDGAFIKAQQILRVFEGEFPVYVYFSDQSKLMIAPNSLWTMLNEPMLRELKRVLGEENVAVKS